MISVIVPAYNAAEVLPACLAALQAQTLPPDAYEIIVVDDGSSDGSFALAASHAGVRAIQVPHGGPAAARNAGVQAARGTLLAFTDSDCVPTPDWLAQLTRPFENPEVVGVRGAYLTHQSQWVARFVQLEYEDKYDRMARRETIDFVDTYSAAYRRAVFLKNRGFETAFPTASVEDQELSFRLSQKGYRLQFVPAARVYHRHDRSLGEYLRRKFWIGYWKAYLLRWHPEKALGDSHTPFTQRLQLGLLALAGLSLAGALAWPLLGWAGLAALVVFLLSAVPFLVKVARRDAPVLTVAPLMLLVRAGALGAGLCAGTVGMLGRRSPRQAAVAWPTEVVKRVLDVVIAVVGLVLALPFLVLIGLAIKLDSPGPVLFVQPRVGQHGKVFNIYKLRTMVANAEILFDQAAAANPLRGAAVKLPRDPRVTRLGRRLRRWSIDELPQLWNVLRGDMSLVGPRPEEPRIVALYTDWHRQRLAVKPGLTGPMQINGRGDLSLDERVQLELDYIQHYSVWRDLDILWRSIPAVISGQGAY
jgi:lipopolysaccharide/colanic/teichoic acid biosynthesis glycosyltransferase/glycosyltransferase involved in cell wall biosynthesis